MKRATRVVSLSVAMGLLTMLMGPVSAGGPKTRLVSMKPNGAGGNGASNGYIDNLSNNGRYAVYRSYATNLVPNDTNEVEDIFWRDLKTGRTIRVSVKKSGSQAGTASYSPAISGNGRHVAFFTEARLVGNDGNGVGDIYVHDVETRSTERVSISSAGAEGDQSVGDQPDLSRSGRFVAFHTASQLVGKDNNDDDDVYVRDLKRDKTRLVSVHSNGDAVTNGDSTYPQITENGRLIVFSSTSRELVNSDGNASQDIFVRNLLTGKTRRVSMMNDGSEVMDHSQYPQISGGGDIVSFDTVAQISEVDDNTETDIYVLNRNTGVTRLVSKDHNGEAADDQSEYSSLSPNGRMVGFYSQATDLVPADPPGDYSAYVYDRVTGEMKMVDRDSAGNVGDGLSYVTGMSGDGRLVLFTSEAGHVAADENGVDDQYRRGPLY